MITVVGSLNRDIVAAVERHPRPGETVLGTGHFVNAGGKGANQAVAAARLGAGVAMVGCVGEDEAGHSLVAALDYAGVDTSFVTALPTVGTGLALITVDGAGENSIVVSPGANGRLAAEHCEAAVAVIHQADVVLLQLEVPLAAVEKAAALAGGRVILNPAPARVLSRELLDAAAVIVPNRTELATLTGKPIPHSIDDAAALGRQLGGVVVVTLGAEGALIVTDDATEHVAAPVVEVVDTTAAGDAFCGALATALAEGETLDAAVRWAVHAGAVTVTRHGAQQSLPTAAEVRSLMESG